MSMEYIVPSLRIANLRDMADYEALEEWLAHLMELEEDQFLARFHQQVQKESEKSWHDHHIKLHTLKVNNLIMLCDSKFTKFLSKFQMHLLGPYIVNEITNGGAVQLVKLNGEPFLGKVNGCRLKLYTGDPTQRLYSSRIVLVLQVVARERETINYIARVGGQGSDQAA